MPTTHDCAPLSEQQIAAEETANVTDLLYNSLGCASQASPTVPDDRSRKRKADSLVERQPQRRRLKQDEALGINQPDHFSYVEELSCAAISGKTAVIPYPVIENEGIVKSEDPDMEPASEFSPAISPAVDESASQIGHTTPSGNSRTVKSEDYHMVHASIVRPPASPTFDVSVGQTGNAIPKCEVGAVKSEDYHMKRALADLPAASPAFDASVGQIGHVIPDVEVRKTYTELIEYIHGIPVFIEEDVYNISALAKRSNELMKLLQQHLLPTVGDRPWNQLLTFTLRLVRAMAAARSKTAVEAEFDIKRLCIARPDAILTTLVGNYTGYSEYEKYAILRVMWLGTPLAPQNDLRDSEDLEVHTPLKSMRFQANCILQVGTSDFVGTFNRRRKHAYFRFCIEHSESGIPALEIQILINKNLSMGFVDLTNKNSYHEISLVWQVATCDFTHLLGHGQERTSELFRQMADLAGVKISGNKEPPEEEFKEVARERVFNISFIPLRTQTRTRGSTETKMRMWQCLRNVDPMAYEMICQLTYPPAPVSIWFVVDCDETEEFRKKYFQLFSLCWA